MKIVIFHSYEAMMLNNQRVPSGKRLYIHNELERSTVLLWEKVTKSRLGHDFNSYVTNYQRVMGM